MSTLETWAAQLGRAVGAFQSGIAASATKTPGAPNASRPRWLRAWAQSEQWKGGDWSATAAQQRAMLNSWLFMAVDYIAREVASAQFQVKLGDTVIENHPLEKLLKRPNPYMGGAFFWQYSSAWYSLAGEYFWYVSLDNWGHPRELWPLPANQVQVWPGDENRFIDHYKYFVNGIEYRLPAEVVVHVRRPNPFDVFRGLSPLMAAMLPVDADMAMARWNGAFFGQDNVMPSAVINLSSGNPNQPINPADAQALENDLRSEYAAVNRKTLVTTANAVDAVVLGWSAREMDFLAGREFSKQEIWQIYGVPPGMLDPTSTEANAVVAERVFKNNIWAQLMLFAEQLTAELVTPFYNPDCEAAFEDIRPGNRELELAEDAQARAVLTIDERRELFWGVKALPEGRGAKTEAELDVVAPVDYGATAGTPLLNAPTVSATPEVKPTENAAQTETLQAVALNGAQVTAAMDIVNQVAAGALPRDSALNSLQTFFGLTSEQAQGILGQAGKSLPTLPTAISPELALGYAEARRALATEFRRWRDKALKSVKDGRAGGDTVFESKLISHDDFVDVQIALTYATTPEAVKAIFAPYLSAAPEVAADEFFRTQGEWGNYG